MRAVMRKREPVPAPTGMPWKASPPERVKPARAMKAQACAVARSTGVIADGAYREDGRGT